MTVKQLGENMTWREFEEWVWLFNHKPFGEDAQDMRFTDLITVYGNSKREKGRAARKLSYFIKRRLPTVATEGEAVESVAERMANKFKMAFGKKKPS